MEDHLKVLKLYPIFFNIEESMKLGKLVELEEIKGVLRNFIKDKSLGPDWWIMKFILHFFDIVC